jgi:hypothetical protein
MNVVNKKAARTVIVLLVAGAGCIVARLSAHSLNTGTPRDQTWRLTYEIQVDTVEAPATVRAAFPLDTGNVRVFRREVQHQGMHVERDRLPRGKTTAREVTMTASRRGRYHVTCEFDLQLSRQEMWQPDPPEKLLPEAKLSYLRSEKLVSVQSEVVRDTLESLRGDRLSRRDLLERIHTYCADEISTSAYGADDSVSALTDGVATVPGRARAAVALCRQARIPSRLVCGFVIPASAGADRRSHSLRPHVWVESILDGRWVPLDPEYDFRFKLPPNFIPVRFNTARIVQSAGITDEDATFAVRELAASGGANSFASSNSPFDIFNLRRLPIEMHEPLALILMLPLGALITAFCRTVVGVPTFGIFTPALLALSFVYADGQTGLVVLPVALGLAFLGRRKVESLQLLLVPRLSVVLTLVVVLLVTGVSVLDWLRLTMPAQAVLLPMVVLTTLVERLYVTSEEDGPQTTARLMMGTVAVSCCCWLLLRWNAVGQILLLYPEAHFLTVAALIGLGRYHGYRLTELVRFRDLAPLQAHKQ